MQYKVVVMGPSFVGKTSIINRFCGQEFSSKTQPTLGIDNKKKQLERNGESLCLCFWDTCGQERYQAFSKLLFRYSHAILVVFDTTKDSFLKAKKMYEVITTDYEVPKKIVSFIVNKIDTIDQPPQEDTEFISQDEIMEYTKQQQTVYYQTSAINNKGIEDCLNAVADRIIQNQKQWSYEINVSECDIEIEEQPRSSKLDKKNQKQKRKCC